MYTQNWGSAYWIAQAKLDLEKYKESKLALMLAAGKNQGPLSEDQQSEYVSKLRTEVLKPSAPELNDEKGSDAKGNGIFMLTGSLVPNMLKTSDSDGVLCMFGLH